MRRKKRFLTLLSLPLWAALGCASSAQVSRFETFATAGTQYTQVVGALLDEAQVVAIDSNSQRLLDSRELATVSRASLEEQDGALRDLSGELQLLRIQTSLLEGYFRGLGRLASPGVPDAFAQEFGNTAIALDSISQALRDKKLLQDEESAQAASQTLGRLVLRAVQNAKLRQELDRRKEAIAEILALQEGLLAALRAQMTADLKYTVERRYERSIAAPFLDPRRLVAEPEQARWMRERRALLTQTLTVHQLGAAAAAAHNLRFAWEKVLRDEFSVADVASVTNELVPILENLNYIRGGAAGGGGGDWGGGGSSWGDSGSGGSWDSGGDSWGGSIGISYWSSRWNVTGQSQGGAGGSGGWGGGQSGGQWPAGGSYGTGQPATAPAEAQPAVDPCAEPPKDGTEAPTPCPPAADDKPNGQAAGGQR
jgi:hypothetical protein